LKIINNKTPFMMIRFTLRAYGAARLARMQLGISDRDGPQVKSAASKLSI
jgi:hypothetical protein